MLLLGDRSQGRKDDWTELDVHLNGPRKMLRNMKSRSFACVVVRLSGKKGPRGEEEHT